MKKLKVLVLLVAGGFSFEHSLAAQRDLTSNAANQLFELHSGFWINLHHFLYMQAVLAAPGTRKDAALAAQAAAPARDMTPDQRRAWDQALAYYRPFGDSDALVDHTVIKANYELSDAGDRTSLAGLRLPPEMAAALEGAAPVYRALWWSEQDRLNRRWMDDATRLIRRYGQTLAPRIAATYRTEWPKEKIPVEVVLYANWAGAYTTTNSTLITVSSADPANQGDAALEVLFHEASHALIGPVQAALSEHCKIQGVVLNPPTLWHAVLFYTTGELVKDLIPNYTPYADAHGLWTRGWPTYIGPLKQDWKPYLDGKTSFDSAVANLVKDVGQPRH